MSVAVQRQNFSYFKVITGMLSRPGTFLSTSLLEQDLKTPVLFLLISTIFFSLASFTVLNGNIVLSAGILILNAAIMPLITSAVSVIFIRIFTLSSVSFKLIFSVHAFAGGTVLLAAWIPMILCVTEPWKWILIIIGYVKGCGMTYLQATAISLITAGFIIGVFQFLINIFI